MRYSDFKIILEYDRSKTVASMGNAIAQRAQTDTYLKSQKVDPVDAVLQQAEETDPTNNKQFVVWIVRQYVKNGLKYEDIYKLKDDLEVFVKTKGQHKRLGINSDIGQYNWKTLADVAGKLSNTELSTDANMPADVKDADILYNGPLGILSVPKSKEASCELGKGTKWCTAATGDNKNMYDYYAKYGPLYIWHDKKRKQKYQFHFETGQFMDAQDQALGAEDARYFMEQNPVTAKLFEKNFDKMEEMLSHIVSYSEREPEQDDDGYHRDPGMSELQEIALDSNLEFILSALDTKTAIYYFKKIPGDISGALSNVLKSNPTKKQEFENMYVKDPRSALVLVDKLYRQPTPHLEDIIAQDARSSYLYAYHVLKGPFKKGEPAIAEDAWAAANYALKILKKRWPPGEEAIKKNAPTWRNYQVELGLIDYRDNPI